MKRKQVNNTSIQDESKVSGNTRNREDRSRNPRDMSSAVIEEPSQNGVKYDNKFYLEDEVRDYDYLERLIASLASSGDDEKLRLAMEREEGVYSYQELIPKVR